MKKLLLLTTGGTISSRETDGGLAPYGDASVITAHLGILADTYDITVRDILHLDSSNIQPEEWQLIARSVYAARGNFDGVVITHGTDTMAYTASMLTFMLLGIEMPVVLTGAQLPIEHSLSDGADNLRTACAFAASGRAGVFIAFDRQVILGCRAVKTHTTDFAAFESVNHPPVARVSGSGLVINDGAIPRAEGPCVLRDKLSNDVFLIKLIPGMDPKIFDMLMEMRYRGVVVEAFGAGGLHFVRRDLIGKLRRVSGAGMSVVVCSQCLYEVSDFTLYETGRRALEGGVIQSRDMTTEAAVAKLMWALGQVEGPDGVRRIFAHSLAGEMMG